MKMCQSQQYPKKASYGVGFALALNPQVQCELNYCQQLRGDSTKFKPGWNVGFSIAIWEIFSIYLFASMNLIYLAFNPVH